MLGKGSQTVEGQALVLSFSARTLQIALLCKYHLREALGLLTPGE